MYGALVYDERSHFCVVIIYDFRRPTRRRDERGDGVVQRTRFNQGVDGARGDQTAGQDDGRPIVTETDSRRRHVRRVREVDYGQDGDHRQRRDGKAHPGHGGRCYRRIYARRVVIQRQKVLLRRSRGLQRYELAVRDHAKNQVRNRRAFNVFPFHLFIYAHTESGESNSN